MALFNAAQILSSRKVSSGKLELLPERQTEREQKINKKRESSEQGWNDFQLAGSLVRHIVGYASYLRRKERKTL